jgi:hypothetical protein
MKRLVLAIPLIALFLGGAAALHARSFYPRAHAGTPFFDEAPAAKLPRDGIIGDIDIEGEGVTDSDLSGITVYWGGLDAVTDENGIFRFPLEQDDFDRGRLRDLSLMVCKRFAPLHDNPQTVSTLKLDKVEKAAWYDLSREEDEKGKCYWEITPRELDKHCAFIPEDCIVVTISSKHVLRIEDTGLYNKHEIFLPRIVVSADAIKRQSVKGILGSLANKKYHEHIKSTTTMEGDVAVSQLEPTG